MELSNFDLWVKGCELNGTNLYCLEGSGPTGLYKTQSWGLVKNDYYGGTPVYHVWINGEFIGSCLSYQTAYVIWENRNK